MLKRMPWEQVSDHDIHLFVLLLQALNDLVDAVAEVKALQERNADADRAAQVEVSVEVSFATVHADPLVVTSTAYSHMTL